MKTAILARIIVTLAATSIVINGLDIFYLLNLNPVLALALTGVLLVTVFAAAKRATAYVMRGGRR